MISSTLYLPNSYGFLPENLPQVSQAPNHVRVIEGENLIAYARPLYTSVDNPNNHVLSSNQPYDGVAKLILTRTDGTFGCSGTLASDHVHVLTAAHCVADDSGNYVLQSGTATFRGNGNPITVGIDASNSKKYPAYDGDFIKGNDIAILKLVTSLPNVPGIPHATSGSSVSSTVYKTGFGLSGYFSSGSSSSAYPFGTQREGQNRYDAFADMMYSALGLQSGTDYVPQAIYQFDSDDGTAKHDAFGFFFGISNLGLENNEVMSASGDSGGPTIQNGKLVGITSYGISLQYTNKQTSDCTKQFGSPKLDSSCGEFAGDTRVASYSNWIDGILTLSNSNNPPTADAGGPYTGTVGNAISFDGSGSSDSDGTISSYSWKFGDGATSIVENPSHAYATPGTYTATLTVTDDDGATDTSTASVTINGGSSQIHISSITPNNVGRGNTVNAVISGSGFEPGVEVSLSNGSGPTPTISYQFVNENTINISISAKSNGPPKSSVFDVVVTNPDLSSDILVGGFTINP